VATRRGGGIAVAPARLVGSGDCGRAGVAARRNIAGMELRRRTFFKLVGVGLVAGCDALGFDVTQQIPEQQVMGSPLGEVLPPLDLFQLPLNLNVQQQTQAMGTGPAGSLKLKSLTLAITSPSDASFDFLTEIAISIAAEGLAKKVIAQAKPVPMGQKQLALAPVGDVDLLPYANKGATLSASAQGHVPMQTIRFSGVVVMHVSV
jgi:hypothetical protein